MHRLRERVQFWLMNQASLLAIDAQVSFPHVAMLQLLWVQLSACGYLQRLKRQPGNKCEAYWQHSQQHKLT